LECGKIFGVLFIRLQSAIWLKPGWLSPLETGCGTRRHLASDESLSLFVNVVKRLVMSLYIPPINKQNLNPASSPIVKKTR